MKEKKSKQETKTMVCGVWAVGKSIFGRKFLFIVVVVVVLPVVVLNRERKN